MKNRYSLIAAILCLPIFVFGQSKGKGITPMHKFFQQYADSTILVEYSNVSDGKPSYYRIISKTDDFVNTFKYEPTDTAYYPLYKQRKFFPTGLWNMLGAKRTGFKNALADINIFFNLVPTDPQEAKNMWVNLNLLKPWKIVDDYSYGQGCKNIPTTVIIDGDPWIIHLITKKEIKTLYYKSPEYYEKQCPGNKNRQAAIQLEKIFKEHYPDFK